jgi:cobalt-zinc-cadmium efflux system outer membrane protein
MHSFGANELLVCSKKGHLTSILFLLAGFMHSHAAYSAPSFTLGQIVTIAAEQNPSINISKAREDSAAASVITAT